MKTDLCSITNNYGFRQEVKDIASAAGHHDCVTLMYTYWSFGRYAGLDPSQAKPA